MNNPLEAERSQNATIGNLSHWFSEMSKEIDFSTVHPLMVGNLDETMLNSKGSTLCCVKKDDPYAITEDLESKEHVTILHLVITGGSQFIPLFVFPLTNMPTYLEDLVKANKVLVFGQDKGWISLDSFHQYIGEFAKWLPHYRQSIGVKSDEKFYIFLDAHGSRKNPDMLKLCMDNHIELIGFPSHCTHILQPLDVGIYALFKKHLRSKRRELARVEFKFVGKTPSDAGIDRLKQTIAAIEALWMSCSPLNIKMSFERTGLYPWNPERALMNPRTHPSTEVTINNRVRKSIQMDNMIMTRTTVIEKLEEEAKTPKKRKASKNRML